MRGERQHGAPHAKEAHCFGTAITTLPMGRQGQRDQREKIADGPATGQVLVGKPHVKSLGDVRREIHVVQIAA